MYPKQKNKYFGREKRGQNSQFNNSARPSGGNSRGFQEVNSSREGSNSQSSQRGNSAQGTFAKREGSFNRDARGGNFGRGDGNRSGGFHRASDRGGFQKKYNHSKSNRGDHRFPSRHKSKFKIDEAEINDFISGEISQPKTHVPAKEYPVLELGDLKVHPELMKNITGKGYDALTPIQQAVIPFINEGRDVVGLANTGTGKTAAFLIPIINKIVGTRSSVLIMAPTRELAMQINDEFYELARGSGMRSVLVIGGASMGRQIQELRRRPSFVIGTPGRLKDLMNQGVFDTSDFSYINLDEADRMLDMGFIGDIRLILADRNPQVQMCFFSATLDKRVNELIREFSKNPEVISVKTTETAHTVQQSIQHYQSEDDKLNVLAELLNKDEIKKTLIFVRTKHGADRLQRKLDKLGLKVEAIHGDKRQGQRERAIRGFREDKVAHMVATDIAARGLDIKNVSHVINYDQPSTKEDYVHRIGRTGRAGQQGYAITFVKK